MKDKAWDDDSEGETCVYLVKDSEGEVALFFSIKCGLLYEKTGIELLNEEEHEYVDMIIEAKLSKNADKDFEEIYAAITSLCGARVDALCEIADHKIDIKNERKELKEEDTTLRVAKCYSAIEIQHFCKNVNYIPTIAGDIPLGYGLFWEIIAPKVLEITQLVGCKFVYLFAADNSDSEDLSHENDFLKLVRYYKNELLFSEISDVTVIKPDYDKYCRALVQSIADIKDNISSAWEKYSDIV